MRETFRTLACVGALATLLAGCGAATSTGNDMRQGGRNVQTERGQQSHPQPVNRLEVDSDSGNIAVRPGQGPGADVQHTLRWNGEKPQLTQVIEGDTLRITAQCPRGGGPDLCEVDLMVAVPASSAVHTDVAAGDVSVSDLAGDLRLRSAAGNVAGAWLRSATVTAGSSAGWVELTFSGSPRSVDAESAAGDVDVYVPRTGPVYAVQATSAAGDVDVQVPDQPDADTTITARSSAGDVTVGYG